MHEQVTSYQTPLDMRRSWSRNHQRSTVSPIESPGSAYSESRLEFAAEDVYLIRKKMKRMEDRVDSMSVELVSDQGAISRDLRNENNRLHQRIANLESKLAESESSFKRDLDEERSRLESMLNRSKRTYESEVDLLHTRLLNLESDLSDCITALNNVKLDLTTSEFHLTHKIEALNKAESKISRLQEELHSFSTGKSAALRMAIRERDEAINNLSLVENEACIRLASSNECPQNGVISQIEQLQIMVRQLQLEKTDLTIKLRNVSEELLFPSIGTSRPHIKNPVTDTDLDKMTKEEVVYLWTQERNANNQLKAYLSSLLDKVISTDPDMLEQT